MSRTHLIRFAVTAAPVVALVLGPGCERTEKPPASVAEQGADAMPQLTVQSSAFAANETVPKKHTGDGQDASPPLSWSQVPAGVKELALIVDDPDAPTPEPWVHWVVYRIPADAGGLPENVPPSERVPEPAGVLQGKNSWGKIGYGGPAPPRGHGLHHYHFKLYALDAPLSLEPGASKQAVLDAMKGHIVAQGELVGTYQR